MKWVIMAYYIALPSGDYTDKLPLPETFSDYESCLWAADAKGIVHYARRVGDGLRVREAAAMNGQPTSKELVAQAAARCSTRCRPK
jgi:hypothetical protein